MGVELGLGEGLIVTVGVGVGAGLLAVGVGVGVGVGKGRLRMAYSAAPIINPLVLSMVVVSLRPFSSMPSTYPVEGAGS